MNTNFAERLQSLIPIDDGTWFIAGLWIFGIFYLSWLIIKQVERVAKERQAASWREREVRALETLARQAEKDEQGKGS